MATKIEWADATINPVVGCSHCSPGCDNCYAERFAARLARNPKTAGKYKGVVDENGKWTGKISERDESVFDRSPKTPKRIFIGSMTDLFFSGVADTPRQAVSLVGGGEVEFAPDTMHVRVAMLLLQIGKHRQHTFMVLTKRAENMETVMKLMLKRPLPNLWLGVTVCNQAEADEKIPVLLQTPAAVRFVSVEPCLGPVDLGHLSWNIIDSTAEKNALTGKTWIQGNCGESSQTLQGNRLDWVICGGETGPGARPMHPDWVRGLRDQCQAADVPFFFKSWGEWVPCSQCADDDPYIERLSRSTPYTEIGDDGITDTDTGEGVICRNGVNTEQIFRVGKRRVGRLLEGVEHNEFPEMQASEGGEGPVFF